MNNAAFERPRLIKGGMHGDDRGVLRFVNDFDFPSVKRFYQAMNHQRYFVRAWQGHEREGKYVYVATGSALVGAVKLGPRLAHAQESGALTHGPSHEPVEKFVLSAETPSILWIPAGYANGWMNLETGTNIFFFSTATLDESKADDFRFPPKHWDIWEIKGNNE